MAEQRRRIGIGDVVERIGGRHPHAHERRPEFTGERLGDLDQQARPIGDAAAIAVGPPVGRIAQELIDQIAVRGMQLDAVEAGAPGIGGGGPIIRDETRDLAGLERARRHVRPHALLGPQLPGRHERRGRDRQRPARLQQRMRDPSDVPELAEDPPPARMDPRRSRASSPRSARPNGCRACRDSPALAGRYLGALADDQAGARALGVIGRHQGGRDPRPRRRGCASSAP